jgi:hypothetical protein
MAFKLAVVDQANGLNFNVKYEKLDKAERPEIEARTPKGTVAKERTVFDGKCLLPGSTQKQWVDDNGDVYSKSELKFFCGEQEVPENTQTKSFNVSGYFPVSDYTDKYVIDKYYELFPHNNDHKKDFDRNMAESVNLNGMYKLWKKLTSENVVARAPFSPSSRGFIEPDGYIRAIKFQNKWGLEIGVFKEEKIFEHLQEGIPQEATPQVTVSSGPTKRLKLV